MTERVGLLGSPVEHSVSPAMFNAAFGALQLDWHYDLLPVSPEQLAERVAVLLAQGYRGFNVTLPHKQAALELAQVREIDPTTEAIGAANTLTALPGGLLRASNTDWLGFAADLEVNRISVHGAECVILGTGGSAKAVASALRRMGAETVVFVSRKPDGKSGVIGYEALSTHIRRASLIINCTPAGMLPDVDASPWPSGLTFPNGAFLYDLIYNPPVTRLMEQARSAGARAIGGLGMLVRQAAFSFEQWTSITPPLDVMEAAARHALT